MDSHSNSTNVSESVQQISAIRKVFKTLAILLSAAWIVVTLSACSASYLNTGEIVSKEYKESYTSSSQICNQSHGGCRLEYTYHPEEWHITLQGLDNENNKETRMLVVSENIYNEVNIGETYTLTQDQIADAQTATTWTTVLLIAGAIAMFSLIGFAIYTQLKSRPANKE